MSNYPTVTIKDKVVDVNRLINPERRIILSNVYPSISHAEFENQIKTLGFTTVSKMFFVKASTEGDDYAHLLSFRRQIYMQNDDRTALFPTT